MSHNQIAVRRVGKVFFLPTLSLDRSPLLILNGEMGEIMWPIFMDKNGAGKRALRFGTMFERVTTAIPPYETTKLKKRPLVQRERSTPEKAARSYKVRLVLLKKRPARTRFNKFQVPSFMQRADLSLPKTLSVCHYKCSSLPRPVRGTKATGNNWRVLISLCLLFSTSVRY